MQTSELQSPKIKRKITHQLENIMQTSEVQCSQTESEMEHYCSVTKRQYLNGEGQRLKTESEMEHMDSHTNKQYHRDDKQ
jgi:hypothetical protein